MELGPIGAPRRTHLTLSTITDNEKAFHLDLVKVLILVNLTSRGITDQKFKLGIH